MCKEFIEFELLEGARLVQSRKKIERLVELEEKFVLYIGGFDDTTYYLSKSDINVETIKSLTEKHKCCKGDS